LLRRKDSTVASNPIYHNNNSSSNNNSHKLSAKQSTSDFYATMYDDSPLPSSTNNGYSPAGEPARLYGTQVDDYSKAPGTKRYFNFLKTF
jgi:hypothetical protein